MLFTHIKQNGKEKGIHIDRVNGYIDHVHCLISLKPGQSIYNISRLIKGESTYWFNHIHVIGDRKLQWQSEYCAI
jgi:REP element-mobilizing transposase RayT